MLVDASQSDPAAGSRSPVAYRDAGAGSRWFDADAESVP